MPRGKSLAEMKASPWIRVELWGEPKTTKTTWSLTAPTPIDYFAWDIGFEMLIKDIDRLTATGVIDLDPSWATRKKEIFPYIYSRTAWAEINKEAALKDMAERMHQFAEDMQEAVKLGLQGSGGTIVIDGGTQLHNDWSFRVDAEMDKFKAQKIFGSPWSKRNIFFKAMLDIAKGSQRNLIMVHHDQDIWDKDGPTGEKQAAGDRLVEREVDLIMRAMKSEVVERDANGKVILDKAGKPVKSYELGFRIDECRGNSSLRGMELPWMTFDQLKELWS